MQVGGHLLLDLGLREADRFCDLQRRRCSAHPFQQRNPINASRITGWTPVWDGSSQLVQHLGEAYRQRIRK
jgi:hypothetical protein